MKESKWYKVRVLVISDGEIDDVVDGLRLDSGVAMMTQAGLGTECLFPTGIIHQHHVCK